MSCSLVIYITRRIFEWFHVPSFVIECIENQEIPKIRYNFVPNGLKTTKVVDKRLKETMKAFLFFNVPTCVTLAIATLLMDRACS